MAPDVLTEDYDAAGTRDFLAMLFGVLVLSGPGLFWLYLFVDELRSTNSDLWFGPTPDGSLSVFAQNVGGIVLGVLWVLLVLVLFWTPLTAAYADFRR